MNLITPPGHVIQVDISDESDTDIIHLESEHESCNADSKIEFENESNNESESSSVVMVPVRGSQILASVLKKRRMCAGSPIDLANESPIDLAKDLRSRSSLGYCGKSVGVDNDHQLRKNELIIADSVQGKSVNGFKALETAATNNSVAVASMDTLGKSPYLVVHPFFNSERPRTSERNKVRWDKVGKLELMLLWPRNGKCHAHWQPLIEHVGGGVKPNTGSEISKNSENKIPLPQDGYKCCICCCHDPSTCVLFAKNFGVFDFLTFTLDFYDLISKLFESKFTSRSEKKDSCTCWRARLTRKEEELTSKFSFTLIRILDELHMLKNPKSLCSVHENSSIQCGVCKFKLLTEPISYEPYFCLYTLESFSSSVTQDSKKMPRSQAVFIIIVHPSLNVHNASSEANLSVQNNSASFHFSPSMLKSLLQKNIRLSRPEAAVRCAHELSCSHGVNEFVRRLPIIMLEDVILHPQILLLVIVMILLSKNFCLLPHALDLSKENMVQFVNPLIPKSKFRPPSIPQIVQNTESDQKIGKTDTSALAVIQKAMDPKPPIFHPIYSSLLAIVYELAAIPFKDYAQLGALKQSISHSEISTSALSFWEKSSLLSIMIRAKWGGQKWDVSMLQDFALVWFHRFENKDAHEKWEESLPYIFKSFLTDSPFSNFDPFFSAFPFRLHLISDDLLLSAVDHHSSDIVTHLLQVPAVINALTESFQIEETAKNKDELYTQHLENILWTCSSSLTNKIPLLEDQIGTNLEKNETLWECFKKVCRFAFTFYSYRFKMLFMLMHSNF